MSFSLDGVGVTHANGFVALADIHIQAQQGESIALIGPSGAGKTTLLNTIATGYLPTAGAMTVLGHSAITTGPALRQLRARIGTVHQAAPIPPRQRVVTAVLAGKLGQWPAWKSLASLVYPQDMQGARQALARVHLAEKLFVRCDQLSGGQLQRVGIARVLYQEAQLILADEPVSALDPTLALDTVQLLVREAKARQATLVASLHAVDLARQCFDRLIGIRHGRVAFDLPAHEVSDAQLQALYAAQAAAAAVPSADQDGWGAVPGVQPLPSHGCR